MTRLSCHGCDGDTCNHSRYAWARLIDAEVIDYYDARSDSLKQNATITFNYTATVHSWSQISVYLDSTDLENTSIRITNSNETVLFQDNSWLTKCAYYDGSWHQPVNASEIGFDLSESYVVEMDLHYSEYYCPLGAFNSEVTQIIIMDENYQPRLIFIKETGTII